MGRGVCSHTASGHDTQYLHDRRRGQRGASVARQAAARGAPAAARHARAAGAHRHGLLAAAASGLAPRPACPAALPSRLDILCRLRHAGLPWPQHACECPGLRVPLQSKPVRVWQEETVKPAVLSDTKQSDSCLGVMMHPPCLCVPRSFAARQWSLLICNAEAVLRCVAKHVSCHGLKSSLARF